MKSIFIQSTFSFDLSRIFFHFRTCSCFLPFIFNAYTDQTLNLSIYQTLNLPDAQSIYQTLRTFSTHTSISGIISFFDFASLLWGLQSPVSIRYLILIHYLIFFLASPTTSRPKILRRHFLGGGGEEPFQADIRLKRRSKLKVVPGAPFPWTAPVASPAEVSAPSACLIPT